MSFVEGLSTAALSLVVAGNEGIAPFLTLFIVGAIERFDPDILSMDEMMENLIASWPGLAFLGIMTILEFVAKCIPVVDEAVDSVMLFIVPLMSVLGSLSTFGLYNKLEEVEEDGDGRMLYDIPVGAVRFLQVVIILIGVGLAVSMHLFLMVVRLLGEGCCTGIITVFEIGFCLGSVIIAIYVKQVAILLAFLMLFAAGYTLKRKWWNKRGEVEGEEEEASGNFENEDNAGENVVTVAVEVVENTTVGNVKESEQAIHLTNDDVTHV